MDFGGRDLRTFIWFMDTMQWLPFWTQSSLLSCIVNSGSGMPMQKIWMCFSFHLWRTRLRDTSCWTTVVSYNTRICTSFPKYSSTGRGPFTIGFFPLTQYRCIGTPKLVLSPFGRDACSSSACQTLFHSASNHDDREHTKENQSKKESLHWWAHKNNEHHDGAQVAGAVQSTQQNGLEWTTWMVQCRQLTWSHRCQEKLSMQQDKNASGVATCKHP